MMLLEQGKVRLNDPVSKFIPEFKGMKVSVAEERPAGTPAPEPARYYTMPSLREITIQDLLTHVSGLGSGPASAAEGGSIAASMSARFFRAFGLVFLGGTTTAAAC